MENQYNDEFISIMYAVIQTGGKQYRLSEGMCVKVERLAAEPGSQVMFDRVLAMHIEGQIKIGAPWIAGAQVQAVVVEHGRHEKINILKFKRRKHHMKRMGHRQHFTQLKIEKILQAS